MRFFLAIWFRCNLISFLYFSFYTYIYRIFHFHFHSERSTVFFYCLLRSLSDWIESRGMLPRFIVEIPASFRLPSSRSPPPTTTAAYSPNFKLVPQKWCHPHRHRYTTSDSLPFRLVLLYLEKSRALRFTSDQLCTLAMIAGSFSNCRSLVRVYRVLRFLRFRQFPFIILNDGNPKIVFVHAGEIRIFHTRD